MKRRQILLIIITTLISIAILGILYSNFYSNKVRTSYLKQGGFTRKALGLNLSAIRKLDLNKGYYTISEFSNNCIVITEYNSKFIIVLDSNYVETKIELPTEINPENIFSISSNSFDNNLLDIECNNDGKIFSLDIKTSKIVKTYKFNFSFEKSIRASKDSFYSFVNSKNEDKYTLALIKFNKSDTGYIAKKSNIQRTSMTDDGIFRKFKDNLIYVNYYNNEILVTDTSFDKITVHHTIDTITTRPKTVTLKNGSITKFLNAPRPVNQLFQISNGLLFINSYVNADNDPETNTSHPVDLIDVYDMNNKFIYVGTIYLDRIDREDRLQSFLVRDNKFVTQYSKNTIVYEFKL